VVIGRIQPVDADEDFLVAVLVGVEEPARQQSGGVLFGARHGIFKVDNADITLESGDILQQRRHVARHIQQGTTQSLGRH